MLNLIYYLFYHSYIQELKNKKSQYQIDDSQINKNKKIE